MPFTGEEVLEVAELYLNKSIADETGLQILNQGLNELGILGLAYGEVTINDEGEYDWYDLPNDTIGPVFVEDESGNLYYRYHWENGKIRFAENGEYKVACRKMPDKLETVAGEIDLNNMYKAPLTKYVCGFIKISDDDMNQDGHKLMQEFNELSARTFQSLVKRRKPSQVRVRR